MIRVVKLFIIGFISILFTSTIAQTSVLQSGPMTTYATMREAKLWVQTKQSAQVYIQYWQKEVPEKKFKTETISTEKDNAFIAHLLAAPLEPSHAYQYEVYINQKLVQLPYSLEFETTPLWKWRGDAPNFSFATGSCAYINESDYDRPGIPYGSNYQIFEAIHQSNPKILCFGWVITYI
jgi:alkaline phosphatase D